jgi:integrase
LSLPAIHVGRKHVSLWFLCVRTTGIPYMPICGQAYLFRERKLAANSVNQRVGALRFFFIKTLKKTWNVDETPYPKSVIRLPKILSPEEVARLIDAATTPFYRTILMTLYATGMRRAELAQLKVSDIDSQRMVIHVQGGKGRKDRDITLSPKLLEALREHWRGLRRKPKVLPLRRVWNLRQQRSRTQPLRRRWPVSPWPAKWRRSF